MYFRSMLCPCYATPGQGRVRPWHSGVRQRKRNRVMQRKVRPNGVRTEQGIVKPK